MPTIDKLSGPVSEYIRNFDLAAVAQRADGRLRVTKNPAGYMGAWWCRAADAKRLLKTARELGGDVVKPAASARARSGQFVAHRERAQPASDQAS
jgi:hypothetical protein